MKAIVTLAVAGALMSPIAKADTTTDAIARLEAKLDALAKENVTLRTRLNKIENRQVAVVSAAPAAAATSAPPARTTAARSAPALESYALSPSRWTGFYIGASGGALWSTHTLSGDHNAAIQSGPSATDGGYQFGGQLGYNYQY